jgi:hypothetical protein
MRILFIAALLGLAGNAFAGHSHFGRTTQVHGPVRMTSAFTRAPAGGNLQLKRFVRNELAPRDGWLPSPGTLGYRQVSQAKLGKQLAGKARSLGAAADGMTIYEKKVGASKVFVFDVAVDGSTFRSVLDAKGRSLQ